MTAVDDDVATENLSGFSPVPVMRPREQVEEQLRAAILSGQLPIGAKLGSEAALAVEFSVSRTTVREALRSLATQGLINKVPGSGGGSFVRSVDHHSFGQVLREGIENLLQLGTIQRSEASAVRLLLEVPAVQLAAQNATPADIAALDRILERLKATPVDHPDIPLLDVEFHTTIARASRNRVLSSLVFALHRATEPVRHLELTKEVGRESHHQHSQIVDAIRAHDPEAARVALVTHLAYLDEHPREDEFDAG